MHTIEKIEVLTGNLKKYVTINYELLKLETIEQTSTIAASIISTIIIVCTVTFFMLFISFGIALHLNVLFGNNYAGFLIVALFYLILSLIFYLFKNKFIEGPICNMVIRKRMNNTL